MPSEETKQPLTKEQIAGILEVYPEAPQLSRPSESSTKAWSELSGKPIAPEVAMDYTNSYFRFTWLLAKIEISSDAQAVN